MAIDILERPPVVGCKIYVVGTGPNGAMCLSKLKRDIGVIVVNRAIDYDWIPRHFWLCDDGTLPEKEWFVKNIEYYLKRKPIGSFPFPVFSEGVLLNAYPDVPYYARHTPVIPPVAGLADRCFGITHAHLGPRVEFYPDLQYPDVAFYHRIDTPGFSLAFTGYPAAPLTKRGQVGSKAGTTASSTANSFYFRW